MLSVFFPPPEFLDFVPKPNQTRSSSWGCCFCFPLFSPGAGVSPHSPGLGRSLSPPLSPVLAARLFRGPGPPPVAITIILLFGWDSTGLISNHLRLVLFFSLPSFDLFKNRLDVAHPDKPPNPVFFFFPFLVIRCHQSPFATRVT